AVVRQKWEFKDDGEIEVTAVKVGAVDRPLLEGGKPNWAPQLPPQLQKMTETLSYRVADGRVELGRHVKQNGETVWEARLPLAATEGKDEKWQLLPSGDFKNYKVVKFGEHKGKRSVDLREWVSLSDNTQFVSTHTFVQGVGEVSRAVKVEKKGASPQLVREMKLVEE